MGRILTFAPNIFILFMALAILVAKVINIMQKEKSNDCLLIELPEYKRPNPRTIRIYVWNKLKDYIYRAGAGLGMWQIVVALIAGISAKEVVVSSFAVLFGVTNTNSATGMYSLAANIQSINPQFGPLNAYSLMIFCLLHGPCIATVTTIKKKAVPGNLHLRR